MASYSCIFCEIATCAASETIVPRRTCAFKTPSFFQLHSKAAPQFWIIVSGIDQSIGVVSDIVASGAMRTRVFILATRTVLLMTSAFKVSDMSRLIGNLYGSLVLRNTT